MIKSAVKKGEFVKNEQNGKTYQIVMFNEFIYLAELDKIAEGVEKLTAADFWKVSGKYFAANFTKVDSEQAPAAALGVGSIVKYKEVIDEGDDISRFVIAEEYGDGRVKVREITSLTAFGFSTYTRNLSDFVAVTDPAEIESLCEIITANDTPLYIQVIEKRKAEAAKN